MDRVSHEDYLKMVEKNKNNERVVVLCYEYKSKAISYGLLNVKKNEYIKEAFKDWNGEVLPFIYKEISYVMLRCDYNRNFILLRQSKDEKNPYLSVEEYDVLQMRRLVSMQRSDL